MRKEQRDLMTSDALLQEGDKWSIGIAPTALIKPHGHLNTKMCKNQVSLQLTVAQMLEANKKYLHCSLRLELLWKSDTCLISFLSLADVHYSLFQFS